MIPRFRRALAADGLVVGVLPAVGKLVGDALVAVDAGLVVLGRLAVEPLGAPLLLLDEPVVGLSPPMRDRMMEIIRRLAGEEGIGIMLIEHVIDLVMSGSDVIVVLSSGEVIAEGTPDEIRQNREVLEAYLGYA